MSVTCASRSCEVSVSIEAKASFFAPLRRRKGGREREQKREQRERAERGWEVWREIEIHVLE